jgi:endothelin-converting enzyme/putative endopeptidase
MYDAEGRTRDYWTEADVAASQAQLACISDRLVAAQASGERCKEETSADFGGLRAAYAALERELGPSAEQRLHAVDGDGLSMQQRFFLAFAQDYCTKMTPAFAEETAQTDWHAPPGVRVDLAVGNMPEFAEAFSCEPPEAVCSVW